MKKIIVTCVCVALAATATSCGTTTATSTTSPSATEDVAGTYSLQALFNGAPITPSEKLTLNPDGTWETNGPVDDADTGTYRVTTVHDPDGFLPSFVEITSSAADNGITSSATKGATGEASCLPDWIVGNTDVTGRMSCGFGFYDGSSLILDSPHGLIIWSR